MARRKHKDVDFQVGRKSFDTFDEAAGHAIAMAVSDGRKKEIDVIVWSKAGARWFAGDYGVEVYEEDPEASVFERIEVKAESFGRIP
jgi:hypothetical protein